MGEDDKSIEEGTSKSKTVRFPAEIWNPIVRQSEKHHCKTSQVIVTIVGSYFDKNFDAPFLPYQCPICMKVNEPLTNYCGECGHPLNQTAAEEMRNFKDYINKFRTDPAVMREYTEWLEHHRK